MPNEVVFSLDNLIECLIDMQEDGVPDDRSVFISAKDIGIMLRGDLSDYRFSYYLRDTDPNFPKPICKIANQYLYFLPDAEEYVKNRKLDKGIS